MLGIVVSSSQRRADACTLCSDGFGKIGLSRLSLIRQYKVSRQAPHQVIDLEKFSRYILRVIVFVATCIVVSNYVQTYTLLASLQLVFWTLLIAFGAAVSTEYVVSHIVAKIDYSRCIPPPFSVALTHEEAAEAVRRALKQFSVQDSPKVEHFRDHSTVYLHTFTESGNVLGDPTTESRNRYSSAYSVHFEIDFEETASGKTKVSVHCLPGDVINLEEIDMEAFRKNSFSPLVNWFFRKMRENAYRAIDDALATRKKRKGKRRRRKA